MCTYIRTLLLSKTEISKSKKVSCVPILELCSKGISLG